MGLWEMPYGYGNGDDSIEPANAGSLELLIDERVVGKPPRYDRQGQSRFDLDGERTYRDKAKGVRIALREDEPKEQEGSSTTSSRSSRPEGGVDEPPVRDPGEARIEVRTRPADRGAKTHRRGTGHPGSRGSRGAGNGAENDDPAALRRVGTQVHRPGGRRPWDGDPDGRPARPQRIAGTANSGRATARPLRADVPRAGERQPEPGNGGEREPCRRRPEGPAGGQAHLLS